MEPVESGPTIEIPPISIKDLDLSKVFLTYDRESDTLMVHLVPRGEPGISIVADDYVYVRMDRSRQRVLGYQIEGFLIAVVPRYPHLLDALEIAELRGITLDEVARLRRDMGVAERQAEPVERVFDWLAHTPHAA